MPVPTAITDLSQTAASNFPAGSNAPSVLDDVQRAHGAFIAQLRDGVGFTISFGKVGEFRLVKSGANLLLSRFNGKLLPINAVLETIPAAGVSLAPTGLLAATLYYIYVYMNGATMALEASTTTHATDSATGIEIKSGDATRSFVGWAYCESAATFIDTAARRGVRSWGNDSGVTVAGAAVSITTAGNSFMEISSSGRAGFIARAGESVLASTSSHGYTTSTNNSVYSGIGLDGATTNNGDFASGDIANSFVGLSSSAVFEPAEGWHYVTPTMRTTGGFNGFVQSAIRGRVGK